jgi:hypothetical protein
MVGHIDERYRPLLSYSTFGEYSWLFLHSVKGANDLFYTLALYMDIDRRSSYIGVAKEFLDCEDVCPIFQKMGGKAMA